MMVRDKIRLFLGMKVPQRHACGCVVGKEPCVSHKNIKDKKQRDKARWAHFNKVYDIVGDGVAKANDRWYTCPVAIEHRRQYYNKLDKLNVVSTETSQTEEG